MWWQTYPFCLPTLHLSLLLPLLGILLIESREDDTKLLSIEYFIFLLFLTPKCYKIKKTLEFFNHFRIQTYYKDSNMLRTFFFFLMNTACFSNICWWWLFYWDFHTCIISFKDLHWHKDIVINVMLLQFYYWLYENFIMRLMIAMPVVAGRMERAYEAGTSNSFFPLLIGERGS